MATVTFNPATGDRRIRAGPNATWATIQAAGTGDSIDVGNELTYGSGPSAILSAPNYIIDRDIIHFDTSSLGASAIISAATLTFYVTNGVNNADTASTILVASTATDTATLALGDFGNCQAVSFGSLDLASTTNDANNVITLNAAGIAAINKTGITKFCLRNSRDVNNAAPTGSNQIVNINSSRAASNKPTLTVTYTVPGADFLFNLI